jgi:hypothetical protein
MAHMDFYPHGGLWLPSVSVVTQSTDPIIDPKKQENLQKWRKRQNNHEQITLEAQIRGKIIHGIFELEILGRTDESWSQEDYDRFHIEDYKANSMNLIGDIKLQNYGREEDIVVEERSYLPGWFAGTKDLGLPSFYNERLGRSLKTIGDYKTQRRYEDLQKEVEQGIKKKIYPKTRSSFNTAFRQMIFYLIAENYRLPKTERYEQVAVFPIWDHKPAEFHVLDIWDPLFRELLDQVIKMLLIYRSFHGPPKAIGSIPDPNSPETKPSSNV